MQACLTFDIDCIDYRTSASVDEVRVAVPQLASVLADQGVNAATWFVRIDGHIAQTFGSGDALLTAHASLWKSLRALGHQVAWHHHCFEWTDHGWRPQTNEVAVIEELHRWVPVARAHGCDAIRLGWGHCTSAIMRTLVDLGLRIDSSAIPRPRYSWDASGKDWSRAPQHPYFPSRDDYQVPQKSGPGLLEVPITTVPLPLPTDSVPDVRRYINPAYHHDLFQRAWSSLSGASAVLVCHPYELLPGPPRHPLLSFSLEVFAKNLMWMRNQRATFRTIDQLAESHL